MYMWDIWNGSIRAASQLGKLIGLLWRRRGKKKVKSQVSGKGAPCTLQFLSLMS